MPVEGHSAGIEGWRLSYRHKPERLDTAAKMVGLVWVVVCFGVTGGGGTAARCSTAITVPQLACFGREQGRPRPLLQTRGNSSDMSDIGYVISSIG